MLRKMPRIYLAAVLFAIVVGFFVYSTRQRHKHLYSSGPREERSGGFFQFGTTSKLNIPISRFAGAEALRNAKSPELLTEIEKVIAQNGLPADVFVDDGVQTTNIAVTLHNQFQEYDPQDPDDPLQKLWEASPIGEWDVNGQALDSVRATLTQFEPKRQIIRSMLEKTSTRFYYIFIRPESLNARFDVGVTVNTEASKYLADYALLEEYAIAQALLDGDIDEAVDALAYIFRITQLASHLANAGTRSDAALVRLRTFDVMQRVILDPKFDRYHMIALRNILSEQHENWTSEYITWFGDRASGIALYHRVAMYGPDETLDNAALAELDRRGIKNAFSQGFAKYREEDQTFYLRSMQQILDVSEEPLTRRLNVLNQIYGELSKMEGKHDDNGIAQEPFLAHLLLKDIDGLMQLFARDQSALNRALVLMHTSLGQSNTDSYRDPFTNEPYTIQKADGLLSITTPTLPHPFRVPSFSEKE